MFCRIPLIFLIALIPTAAIAQQTPAALPTSAEIRTQVEAGEFAPALKNLTRVLELKGSAAVPYNRPELLLLRGECLLQTRQATTAKTALDDAFKESLAAGDSITAGEALALAALITKSSNMTYTPKKGNSPIAPKPIGILDRAARPDAYKALFDDMLPDTKNKTRAAVQSSSMTAIMSAARDAAALRAMEKLAAGPPDPADSQKLAADLLNRADALTANSLNQMSTSVHSFSALANQIQAQSIEQVDPVSHVRQIEQVGRRRGLSPSETQSVKSIQQTCTQIVSSLHELSVEFAAPENFKQTTAAAVDLQKATASILNDDYSLLSH